MLIRLALVISFSITSSSDVMLSNCARRIRRDQKGIRRDQSEFAEMTEESAEIKKAYAEITEEFAEMTEEFAESGGRTCWSSSSKSEPD